MCSGHSAQFLQIKMNNHEPNRGGEYLSAYLIFRSNLHAHCGLTSLL